MAYWKELRINTSRKVEFLDITGQLAESLRQSGVREGFGIVFVPHTTAGVTINENADPDVVHDLIAAFERLAPEGLPYRHAEGNSPAHLQASLVGTERLLPVCEGRLALGTWQGVYFCEFDGPRSRRVIVSWQNFS